MKRILITGVNSYIGNNITDQLSKFSNKYEFVKISLKSDKWKSDNWSNIDTIIHVAGIAHNSSNKNLKDLYYEVNTNLSIEVAIKAKNEGVRNFIYLSSLIVYGSNISEITSSTEPIPDNFYGDSKLKAEEGILKLMDDDFNVAILRPPMVYGKESKGNFSKLVKFARFSIIFPKYHNKRSMIYIKNLVEYIKYIIDLECSGVFHPQNTNYVSTSEMVEQIAKKNNHKLFLVNFLNPIITRLIKISILKKVFGDLYYHKSMSREKFDYQLFNFEESINDIFN